MTLNAATLFLSLPLLICADESSFLSHTRQLTFGGKRAGEGYFSKDGKSMVFQSEREEGNPFYQIYRLDLETGDLKRVSPGTGKTTCAWLNPDGKRVLFASTQDDPKAAEKAKDEYKQRESGKERRYSWDYDPSYDLYEANLETGAYTRLTSAMGYDAEGSYSPDGASLVFASNRAAYADGVDKKALEMNPSGYMDIHTAKADGTDVKRLTDAPGYDGGPFYSADGKKICWRRFSEDGARAEIHVMNADGSDQHAITKLGAMSWAPYFHPSGDYLIFATNLQGFANFELYLVRADGQGKPVRVTTTDGFDGLPVFSPDGKTLSWTSNRNPEHVSQIYLADWNDKEARQALGLEAAPSPATLSPEITESDIRQDVGWLASDRLRGRLTGTEGEKLAGDFIIASMKAAGLEPGWKGEWRDAFSFTSGVAPGPNNHLSIIGLDADPKLEKDWRPLSFSQTGETPFAPVVFAGYGIEPPEDGKNPYSSYAHLDVKGKWVLMFRYAPEKWSADLASERAAWTSLRAKAMTAREKGAVGILIVSGPNSKVVDQLVPLSFDASVAGSGVTALSIRDDLAQKLVAPTGKTLQQWQDAWDKGDSLGGVEIPGVTVAATVDIKVEKREGANIVGVLKAPGSTLPPVLVGAHYDHLGDKAGANSRAGANETSMIHHGADDNASGVAGVLEIAAWLNAEVKAGRATLKRDVIFAGWSGEELGLLGSSAFLKDWKKMPEEKAPLTQEFSACVNMDMIGRMREHLILQAVGSSPAWPRMIEKANVASGLPLVLQNDPYLPTDAMEFHLRKVPVLNFFTGAHAEYHTPRDTADTLNYPDTTRIVKFAARIVADLAREDVSPPFTEMPAPKNTDIRGGMRAYLGTIPDYAQGDVKGVKLSGVTALAPAAKAGVKGGDIIVDLAGHEIQNIYDYTQVIGGLKVGQEVDMTVQRGGEALKLKITPGSRE